MGIKAEKRSLKAKIRIDEMSRLRDIDKLSYQDIGQMFGISRQRVWDLLHPEKRKSKPLTKIGKPLQ